MEQFLTEKLLALLDKWRTRPGYFVVLALLLLLALQVGPASFQYSAILMFGLTLTWTIVWLVVTGRVVLPRVAPSTVVLAFDVDATGRANYKRVVYSLRQELDALRLTRRIRIIDAAPDLISNQSSAERYRNRNHPYVDLLIWGKGSHGQLSKEEQLIFDVSTTCRLSDTLRDNFENFQKDILLIHQGRRWTILDANELQDVRVVAAQLLETCMFLVGIYMMDAGRSVDAIAVFERLLILIANRPAITSAATPVQTRRIKELLVAACFVRAYVVGLDNDHSEQVRLLAASLPHAEDPIPVLIFLARSYFLDGNVAEAERLTNEIRKLDRKHPAVFLNIAFFGIRQGNYDRALFWYDQLLKLDHISVDLLSVVDFLDAEYTKNPAELAYLYAIGAVSATFDGTRAKTDLRRFQRLTRKKPEYDRLRARAGELLKRLERLPAQ